MKFSRILALVLILVLASSQAMAAACSTSCQLSDIQTQTTFDEMAGMDSGHCHHQKPAQDQHQEQHKTCTMAGCHVSQVPTLGLLATYITPHFSNTTLPHFAPLAVSADLSPPVKPPA